MINKLMREMEEERHYILKENMMKHYKCKNKFNYC